MWPESLPEREQAVKAILSDYGARIGASVEQQVLAYKIAKCENDTFDPLRQSEIINAQGIQEDSWGISQIHMPSWKGQITIAMATDPVWSTQFLLRKIKEGDAYLWSCSRKV